MRILTSSAVIALLATTAWAQRASEAEPEWYASALALVPAGYVAGNARSSDAAGTTGYLAVYAADANDPKTPASVFTPLGAGGKPRRRARLVAQPLLQPGDDLQLKPTGVA